MPSPSSEFFALQRALAGRYSLIREIGRGGMSVVFLARDVALNRQVAVKLLRRELLSDAASRARFVREARTAARLFHPNIVPVHAVEETDEMVVLVMAFVEGETLGQRVRRAGPLSPMATRRLLLEVTWALEHAHGEGVIHLDVKPDNILLERDSGRAMVTDFGIARLAQEERKGPGDGKGGGELAPPHEVLGTVQYMSPEQVAGRDVEPRSDLYSLGVTAYFASTGRHPFPAPGPEAPIRRHLLVRRGPSSAEEEGVPARLAAVVDSCLHPRPERRPPSAAALASRLQETEVLTSRLPPEGRKAIRDLRQGVVLSGVAAALLAFWPHPAFLVGTGFGVLLGFVSLLGPARKLLRKGFDVQTLERVLADEAREWAAGEGGRSVGFGEGLVERIRNLAVRWGPAPLGGLAVVSFVLGPSLEPGQGVGPAAALLLAAAVLLGAGPAPPEGSPARKLDLGERLLVGRFGRLLLGVAGVGLPKRERHGPSGRPTEVILAGKVEDGFRQLPPEFRRRFGRVPDLIRRLEAHVQALRRRDEELAAAQARIHLPAGGGGRAERERMHGELDRARAEVGERLAAAVGALEHLRLDLSRLSSDPGPDEAEALTGRLTRALEMADDLDAAMPVTPGSARPPVKRREAEP